MSAAESITLRWTAPGDDGLVGRAQAYDLRRSSAPITEETFDAAARVTGLPAPGPAGSIETFQITGLDPDSGYYFAIRAVDEAGNRSALSNVLYLGTATVDVSPLHLVADLSSPWPNPARRSSRLAYRLPEAGEVRADVFDARGRRVRTLARGSRPAGQGEMAWDLRDDSGRPAGAGVYFVQAHLGGRTFTRRLVVVR